MKVIGLNTPILGRVIDMSKRIIQLAPEMGSGSGNGPFQKYEAEVQLGLKYLISGSEEYYIDLARREICHHIYIHRLVPGRKKKTPQGRRDFHPTRRPRYNP
jgi:hypothetical protein